MAGREGPSARGRARGTRLIRDLGAEIRGARLQRGLSLGRVGAAVGMSGSQLSRLERGLATTVDVPQIGALCGVVGLDLSLRAFPGGQPVRDAAHLALIGRFRRLLAPSIGWRGEVPVTLSPGDLRAWDAVLSAGGRRGAAEFETRPRDLQELQRRLGLKERDGDADVLLLVLADTRHNRALVRAHAAELAGQFPVPASMALARLRVGQLPEGNAILLV